MIQIVLGLDPDENVEEQLLNVVEGGRGREADERVGGKEESFLLVRLSDEDAQPDVHGQVEKPGRNVERAGPFRKADQSRRQRGNGQD